MDKNKNQRLITSDENPPNLPCLERESAISINYTEKMVDSAPTDITVPKEEIWVNNASKIPLNESNACPDMLTLEKQLDDPKNEGFNNSTFFNNNPKLKRE